MGNIIFRDSLNHLPAALDSLAKTLKSKTDKKLSKNSGWEVAFEAYAQSFPTLYKYFEKNHMSIVGPQNFHKIIQKGVFPYTYFTSDRVFSDQELPERKHFYNDLQQKELSEVDYQEAKNLWSLFKMENFGQWHDLYLLRDVYLLCDVFENYRDISFSTYGLDPVGYLTAPALSWNCGLKYTGAQLELLTDVEKILFIDSALYGGYSAVVNPYSKANTPAMGDKYREDRPRSDIIITVKKKKKKNYDVNV